MLFAWADRIQGFGLYLTALSLFLIPVGVAFGLVLIWLGFLLSLGARRRLPLSSGVWLGVAFGAYVVVNGVFAALPESSPTWRLARAGDWVQLCVFMPAAYALRGDSQRLLRLLFLALVGLLLGMLWRLDWGLLLSDASGFLSSRPGFGFPAIVFALFSGIALIGLFVFRERCWMASTRLIAALRVTAWIIATAMVAQGFMLTLSRGAWIALVLTGIAAIWLPRLLRQAGRLDPHPSESQPSPSNWSAAAGPPRSALHWFVGVLLLGLVVFNAPPFVDRLSQEQAALSAELAGEADAGAQSSLSLRWGAQRFGFEAWIERPLLGWGPGSSDTLLAASANPVSQGDGGGVLAHLHNTYLELLVQLGLLGLVLWCGIFICLFMSLVTAWRRGRLTPDTARFLILAMVYLSIWNLFDFHALHQDWRGLWTLLAGAALSVGLFAGVGEDGSPDNGGERRLGTACASR